MSFLKNRTVVGVICILLSLLICFGLTPLFNQSVSQKAEIVRVVQPIRAGDEITESMVQTVEVGGYNLPEDVLRQKESAVGKYPLMEWGWSRKDCIQAIRDAGLPLPGKSSCFFCPSMKRWEIRTLYHRYPDLLRRALAIEDAAMPNLTSVRGLGRNWAWRDFICADENQLAIPGAFSDEDLPCSCCMKGELPAADL